MERDRFRAVVVRVAGGLEIRLVHGVALRGRRQIGHRLGQRRVALRHADEVARLLRGDGDGQRLRVGVADVLGGEPHQPPRDVERVLAGLEHAREPVHRGVGVAVAHRLVEGGDQVVVLFARLVVEQRPPLDRLPQECLVDPGDAVHRWRRGRGELEQVQGDAPVPVRVPRHALDGLVGDADGQSAEPARLIGERPPEDGDRVVLGERLEDEDLRPREQRRVDLERRVLGGGADEDDVARLDPREERVLLGLVEAVDLVDEQNRAAPARAPGPLGLGHHLADLLDAREHRRKRDEVRARRLGDEPREARLPRARRAPENHRLQQVALDGLPQRLAGRQQVLLAHVLVEGARAHALGKRRAAPLGRGGRIVEQVGVRHDRPPPWRWR